MRSNFEFLEKDFPALAHLGLLAEQYCYSDPNACIMKLGMIGESIVDMIFKFKNLPDLPDNSMVARINYLYRMNLISYDVCSTLHILRKSRNKAVHQNYSSLSQVRLSLPNTYVLCEWFMQAYGDQNYKHHDFVFPGKQIQSSSVISSKIPGISTPQLSNQSTKEFPASDMHSSPSAITQQTSQHGTDQVWNSSTSIQQKQAVKYNTNRIFKLIFIILILILVFLCLLINSSPNVLQNRESENSVSTEQQVAKPSVIPGYWDDHSTNNPNVHGVAYILNHPLHNYTAIQIKVDVEMNYGARCKNWTVFVNDGNTWQSIGELYLPDGQGAGTVSFTQGIPSYIHSFIISPNIPGSYSWTMDIKVVAVE